MPRVLQRPRRYYRRRFEIEQSVSGKKFILVDHYKLLSAAIIIGGIGLVSNLIDPRGIISQIAIVAFVAMLMIFDSRRNPPKPKKDKMPYAYKKLR